MHYLYKITNMINEHTYIGQTIQPTKRWNAHKNAAARSNASMLISHAIKKHGQHNFEFEVIATCKTQDDANETEILLIEQYGSHCSTGNGYNVDHGGDVTVSRPLSEEHKSKLRKPKSLNRQKMGRKLGSIPWNKGKKGSQVAWNKGITGKKSHSFGQIFTEERKANISKGKTKNA